MGCGQTKLRKSLCGNEIFREKRLDEQSCPAERCHGLQEKAFVVGTKKSMSIMLTRFEQPPFDMARDYFSISSKVELAQKMSDWHTNFT